MLSEFMVLVRFFCLVFSTTILSTAMLTTAASAESTRIAVASNFTPVMKALIAEFEQNSMHKVKASYASSGKFYAQIYHGAPYDIFFSADQAKPLALEKEGLIIPSSRFTYALGGLALWSNNIDFKDQHLARLKTNQFNKLSLANPKLAPYGLAATQVLDKLALRQQTKSKWVQGENIAQTYQFVATGNADLGFIALSQVFNTSADKQSQYYWQVPKELYNPIKQDLVLLKRGADNVAAKAFIQFIKSAKAQGIIRSYGYSNE